MIERRLSPQLAMALDRAPAVALIGPRQVGKTTLARAVAGTRDSVYLDLESDADRARLAEPELYLASQRERLVVLDEVHRAPGLFPVLRGQIDAARREGRRAGRYLLLGSASFDLLKQSGESLAGRIAFLELTPFDVLEVADRPLDTLWVRGGFPESFLAPDGSTSAAWRQDFIRTYLERDVPQFGPRIAAETLRRFWTMLAHHQGGMLNVAALARGLGIETRTALRYVDLLVDLLLVRRLAPWHANVGKRLVKSPKVYVRDSGLVHTLLHLGDRNTLLGHPVVGASWEGFVIENLLACAPPMVQPYFYRTRAGAEIDLFLVLPDGATWALEIKRSAAPKARRGFHVACEDLNPSRRLVVYPGTERFPLGSGIEAIPVLNVARELSALR